jgi:hypothetical protein
MLSVEERGIKYLNCIPPAIQGQRGSDAAFKAGLVLTQGFAMDEEKAFQLFMQYFNPRCAPPWPEKEARHKIRDAARANTVRPRGYLLKHDDTQMGAIVRPKEAEPRWDKPTQEDCLTIARSRNLHGPGIYLAGLLGAVKAGDWFNQRTWAIGDANGQPASIRRLDGQPFAAYGGIPERKTHCLVSGAAYHKPQGFIDSLPNVKSIVLCEGLPDYLALWEQLLWESQIEAIGGNPFKLGNIEQLKPKIHCLPLAMLATGARINGNYLEWFRGKLVRIFVHNEDTGKAAAQKWAKSIAQVANHIDMFDCGKVKNEPGFDFNDCFQLISGKVLP